MLLSRALLVLALTTPMLSADVLVVDAGGGGDFTTLSAAVSAAVNGDTILVRQGDYFEASPIVIDGKSLTVTGELQSPGAEIQPGLVVQALQPGQRVVLQNLRIVGSSGTPLLAPRSALTLLSNGSHVRVENCDLFGGHGLSNLHPDGAPAVAVSDSLSSALVGCSLQGGSGQFSPSMSVVCGDGGAGLSLEGGTVSLGACILEGGWGGSNIIGAYPYGGHGGHGIEHLTGTLFVVGGQCSGGDGGVAHVGGDGGDGVTLGFESHAWLMGGMYAEAGDGVYGDETYGVDGVAVDDPFAIVTDYGGTVHGFEATSPVHEGQGGTLDLQGEASDSTLLFAALSPFNFPLPGHQGVLLVNPTGMIGPIAIGPGNGALDFVAPTLPASLDVLHVFLQPAYVGGDGTVLGTGRLLTILDSSL